MRSPSFWKTPYPGYAISYSDAAEETCVQRQKLLRQFQGAGRRYNGDGSAITAPKCGIGRNSVHDTWTGQLSTTAGRACARPQQPVARRWCGVLGCQSFSLCWRFAGVECYKERTGYV